MSSLALASSYKQVFSHNISNYSIRSLFQINGIIFAGGYDETIRLYDLHSGMSYGELSGHSGAILKMEMSGKYLFSCGEDGFVNVYRSPDWQFLHAIPINPKSGINDFDLHSSAKIMLAASKNHKLYVIDIVKCEKVYTKRFTFPIEKLAFLKDEEYVGMVSQDTFHIVQTT